MSSLAIYNDSSNILIGKWSGDNTNLFSGYLDELCITLGNAKYQDTFTSPISDIGKYTNLHMYVSTLPTNNFSLTAINQINSITMPVSVPTGTNVNCLLSFDNGVHKLYKDASGFHIFTGDLSQLWTYCNSYSEIIGYFTNKTIDSITSDLTPLNIIPASIDLYWQLVSDGVNTPIVSPIAINYTTSSYEEFASFGGYTDSYVKYGVKRLSTNTISVKNKSTETTTIKVNLVIS
jgi:hypothetical protein